MYPVQNDKHIQHSRVVKQILFSLTKLITLHPNKYSVEDEIFIFLVSEIPQTIESISSVDAVTYPPCIKQMKHKTLTR